MYYIVSIAVFLYLIYKVINIDRVLKKQQADQEEIKSLLKILIKSNNTR
ncbi:hypothetical protein [Halobacillus dabanensis]|nr:hypothetical protein [Halobacillus dabanensis]